MPVDVPQAESASVDDRLKSFFGAPAAEPSPVEPEVSQPEAAEAPIAAEGDDDQPPAAEEEVSDEEQQEQPADNLVELEHLGQKYKVDPALKTAFESTRAMATKATQEFSNRSRALEIEKMAMQASKAFDAEISELSAQKAKLQSYKDQARNLDWSSLTLDQKVDLDRELRNIDAQLADIDKQTEGKRNEHKQRFNKFVVEAVITTEKHMQSKVPGWNEDAGKALSEYGQNYGIPVEKLTAGWFADPVATEILWKAQQWDKVQSSKPQVLNKAANAPPVVKPGSNAVQKSVAASGYQKDRAQLKKTGSLQDAARLFLRMK